MTKPKRDIVERLREHEGWVCSNPDYHDEAADIIEALRRDNRQGWNTIEALRRDLLAAQATIERVRNETLAQAEEAAVAALENWHGYAEESTEEVIVAIRALKSQDTQTVSDPIEKMCEAIWALYPIANDWHKQSNFIKQQTRAQAKAAVLALAENVTDEMATNAVRGFQSGIKFHVLDDWKCAVSEALRSIAAGTDHER